MASKRKRKLEKKSSKDFKDKMQARRASANDALWTYGLPLAVILVVGLGVYFAFFYEMGDPRAEEWELEDPQSGEVYASEDYYNNRLTIVEFFNSKCGACQTQAPILNDVHANYSSQVTKLFTPITTADKSHECKGTHIYHCRCKHRSCAGDSSSRCIM